MAFSSRVVLPFSVAVVAVFAVCLVLGGQVQGFIPTVPQSVTPPNPGPGRPISPAFWGTTLESSNSLGPFVSDIGGETGVTYARFPSGIVGEATNLTANLIYANATGVPFPSPIPANLTTPEFVDACRAIHCHAIIELPMEIDSPSTAAYEVAYLERTLAFFPAYWELGNEPAGWQCYGLPWAEWNSSSTCGTLLGPRTSPSEFAHEVKDYIAAIRTVDPSTPISCLGGSGTQSDDAGWITPILQVNGMNCQAISIHVRPASHYTGLPTLADFMSFLGDDGSNLPARLQTAQSAVAAGCSSCSTQILVTELGSATPGSSYGGCGLAELCGLGAWADVVFEAAQVSEGLNSGAYNLDYFSWHTGGGAALWNGAETTPLFTLYSSIFRFLQPMVYSSSLNGTEGVYGTASGSPNGTAFLLVNTQVATEEHVNVAASGFPTSPDATWHRWVEGESAPAVGSVNDESGVVTLPPLSVSVVVTNGSVTCPAAGCGLAGAGGGGPTLTPASITVTMFTLAGVLAATGVAIVVILPGPMRLVCLPFLGLAACFVLSVPALIG